MCHLPRVLFIRSINQGEALKRIVLNVYLECAHLCMSQIFMDMKVGFCSKWGHQVYLFRITNLSTKKLPTSRKTPSQKRDPL